MKKNIKILAIESSCDETAAAVICGVLSPKSYVLSPTILSNIVSSQADLHAKTGGVVPEVASRAHMEAIIPVIAEALSESVISTPRGQSGSEKSFNCNLQSEDPSTPLRFAQDDSERYSEAIKILQDDIDYIAVTSGPGLVGSLLVGFNAAKTLAYALDKPIIPINHIEGHIYSAFSQCYSREGQGCPLGCGNPEKTILDPRVKPEDDTLCRFPILSLTVSGGHTSLTLMKDHGDYENLGQTLDDAAGEAFDKVAKLLDLGYPGGPIVSKLANEFRNREEQRVVRKENGSQLPTPNSQLIFPRPVMNDGTFNFSFSGLKTAVLQYVLNIKKERNLTLKDKQEICAAFEDAVVDVLVTKTIRAAKKYEPKAVILAGGVAANKHLRDSLKTQIQATIPQLQFYVPDIKLCGDNAAMIGLAAYYHIQKDDISSWDQVKVDSNLELN